LSSEIKIIDSGTMDNILKDSLRHSKQKGDEFYEENGIGVGSSFLWGLVGFSADRKK
jgi:hypothetical protein